MLAVKPTAAKPIATQPCRRAHTPRCKPMQPSDTCLQSNLLLLNLSPHSLAAVHTYRVANPCSTTTHANSPALLLSPSSHSLAAVYTHRVATHAARRHMLAVKPAATPIAAQPCRRVHTPRCKPMQPSDTCQQSIPAAKPIATQPCRRVHTPRCKPIQPGGTCLQSNLLLSPSPHSLAAVYTHRVANPCGPATHANNQACC